MIQRQVNISERYTLRKEDFQNDSLTIRINKDIEFVLIIRNFRSLYTDFQLHLKTEIYGTLFLSSVITFENPKGARNDINIILNGCMSKNNALIKLKQETSFLKLDKLSFFLKNDFIIMKIQIKSINQSMIGLCVKSTPTIKDIEKKIMNFKSKNEDFSFNNIKNTDRHLFFWMSSVATAILLSQPSLIYLRPPIVIVGDVRGKFLNLYNIFLKFGFPGTANYLFLGNYSESKDAQSITLALLLFYKIRYPNNIFLLRGQQESEYALKYGDEENSTGFVQVLRALPFAAIIGNKIFCVHSGISPLISTLSSIEKIARPCNFSDKCHLSDLIFSEPNPNIQLYSIDKNISYFGSTAVQDFIKKFEFELIVRSQQCVQNGYEFTFSSNSLVSIFSAANIQNQNKGVVMVVDKNLEYLFYNIENFQEKIIEHVYEKGLNEKND